MSVFRYIPNQNKWFKGNTHIHSTVSDGGKNFTELADMYAKEGYNFLFRTDHWNCPSDAMNGNHYPLAWFDGIELDGYDHTKQMYHVCCLGKVTGIEREMGIVGAVEAVRRQGGILILAHPLWCGNHQSEIVTWGFHGVEVYNHICQWLNGKGNGTAYWQALMEKNPNILGFASDDAHINAHDPGWNGGWIMVNAAECTQEAIMDSIRKGTYYSTQGPRFEEIRCDGNQVYVKTTPASFIRLVGPAWRGTPVGSFDGKTFTEASFTIPTDWQYAYLEIEDIDGKHAWTNNLWVTEV